MGRKQELKIMEQKATIERLQDSLRRSINRTADLSFQNEELTRNVRIYQDTLTRIASEPAKAVELARWAIVKVNTFYRSPDNKIVYKRWTLRWFMKKIGLRRIEKVAA